MCSSYVQLRIYLQKYLTLQNSDIPRLVDVLLYSDANDLRHTFAVKT
jgi:hypothetical protein